METQQAKAGGRHRAKRDFLVPFGERVRALRKEQGLSLGLLAKLSGIAKAHLSMIENGLNNATAGTIFAIARALDVPPLYLVLHWDKPGGLADDIEQIVELMRLLPLDVVRRELDRVMPNAPRFEPKSPRKARV